MQSLLKGRNAQIWRMRAPTHMRLSGTDGLIRTAYYLNARLAGLISNYNSAVQLIVELNVLRTFS